MSKYGQICISCGRSHKKINKDGECPSCVRGHQTFRLKKVGEL